MTIKRFILTTFVGPAVLAVVLVGFVPKAFANSTGCVFRETGTIQVVRPTPPACSDHESRDKFQQLVAHIPGPFRRAFFRVGRCESGGKVNLNTGNGFLGWLQFTPQSWHGLGYKDLPHQASRAKQLWAGWRLGHQQGWGAWPVCSRKTGATSLNIYAARLTVRPHFVQV